MCHDCRGKKTQSTIKVLENTHIKNQRLKSEAVTKMDEYFTICQHKTEEPTNIELSTPVSLDV